MNYKKRCFRNNSTVWGIRLLFYNLSPQSCADIFVLFNTRAFVYDVERRRHAVESALLVLILRYRMDQMCT